jgi:hypothetical protein
MPTVSFTSKGLGEFPVFFDKSRVHLFEDICGDAVEYTQNRINLAFGKDFQNAGRVTRVSLSHGLVEAARVSTGILQQSDQIQDLRAVFRLVDLKAQSIMGRRIVNRLRSSSVDRHTRQGRHSRDRRRCEAQCPRAFSTEAPSRFALCCHYALLGGLNAFTWDLGGPRPSECTPGKRAWSACLVSRAWSHAWSHMMLDATASQDACHDHDEFGLPDHRTRRAHPLRRDDARRPSTTVATR